MDQCFVHAKLIGTVLDAPKIFASSEHESMPAASANASFGFPFVFFVLFEKHEKHERRQGGIPAIDIFSNVLFPTKFPLSQTFSLDGMT